MGIIIDTGVYYAKYNSDDNNHDLTKKIFTKILRGKYGQPFLLDYVFDEFATLVQARTKRNDTATQLGNKVLNAKYHEFIRVNYDIFKIAWQLFQNQKSVKGKFLSFTDCAIISTAKFLSIENICTLEENFSSVNLEGIKIIS